MAEHAILTSFSGMAGQAAVEFDDDSPAVTGVLGTVIHDNWAYRLSERKRLAGSVAPGYLTLCQGEADRNLAPGAWHCKTDQIDLAEFYAGVLMCPMHPFPIGADGVHFLWQDSYRIADTGAWALAEIEAGRNWPALRPSAQRDGHVVTLRYALRRDEQLRRIVTRYPSPETHWGYEAEGATITAVQQIGACVHRLTCSAPPGAIRYALQSRDMTGQGWSAHHGEVATTLTAPSTLFPDETLTRDAPPSCSPGTASCRPPMAHR